MNFDRCTALFDTTTTMLVPSRTYIDRCCHSKFPNKKMIGPVCIKQFCPNTR